MSITGYEVCDHGVGAGGYAALLRSEYVNSLVCALSEMEQHASDLWAEQHALIEQRAAAEGVMMVNPFAKFHMLTQMDNHITEIGTEIETIKGQVATMKGHIMRESVRLYTPDGDAVMC